MPTYIPHGGAKYFHELAFQFRKKVKTKYLIDIPARNKSSVFPSIDSFYLNSTRTIDGHQTSIRPSGTKIRKKKLAMEPPCSRLRCRVAIVFAVHLLLLLWPPYTLCFRLTPAPAPGPAPVALRTITVDKQGGGDFRLVQSAVNFVPDGNCEWIRCWTMSLHMEVCWQPNISPRSPTRINR
jgi:hypothetical protein